MTEILTAVLAESRGGVRSTDSLVRMCVRALPVTGAGLALMTPQGPAGTLAATDPPAQQLEELQFALGEGPCVDASRTGRPVLEPDLAASAPARWPVFAEEAEAAGLRAVFALPLRIGGIEVGVLDLYRDTVGVLSPAELTEALAFADVATALVLHLQYRDAATGLPLDSIQVLDDRAEIHQATGVVSVHAGVGLAEALVLLRARAYADQRPVADVARDVLNGLLDFRENHEDG